MPRTKRSRMEMSPINANAAAIDIGATLHVAAVGPDRDPVALRPDLRRALRGMPLGEGSVAACGAIFYLNGNARHLQRMKWLGRPTQCPL